MAKAYQGDFDRFDKDDADFFVPRTAPCYETHKGLKVGEHTIFGGSASNPQVLDADLYVSLQRGSTSGKVSDPWAKKEVREIQLYIPDGHSPKAQPKRFARAVEYIVDELNAGKKIHVGCIGGHGRTGMVLAAVYAKATGKKDAIQYVRKNYCKRAVETDEQIKFLMDNYGVSSVSPSKPRLALPSSTGFTTSRHRDVFPKGATSAIGFKPTGPRTAPSLFSGGELLKVGGQMAPQHIIPMEYSKKSIWKPRLTNAE